MKTFFIGIIKMNFKTFINEAKKTENGNGSKELNGENIELHTFADVHNNNKRLAISINTIKNRGGQSSWTGEKFDEEKISQWVSEIQDKIIDELESDLEKLDKKISKILDRELGKDRTRDD